MIDKKCKCGEQYTVLNTIQITDVATYDLDKKAYILKDADLLVDTPHHTHINVPYVMCYTCGGLCEECIKKSQEIGFIFIHKLILNMNPRDIFCSDKCINCDVLPPK